MKKYKNNLTTQIIFNANKAFTIAEIIIVLGIIGIVAALTIPAIITEANDKALNESITNTQAYILEAINEMRTQGKLSGYNSTEAFMDEFSKYLKITKRCSSTNIDDCFPKTIGGSTEAIETRKLKTGENISTDETGDYTSTNVSAVLVNGSMAIFSYNKNCDWLNPYERKNRDEAAMCLSAVVDVNGWKGPNKVGKDIYLYRAKTDAGFACKNVTYGGSNYCVMTTDLVFSPSNKPCWQLTGGTYGSGTWSGQYYTCTNYRDGAIDACQEMGGYLTPPSLCGVMKAADPSLTNPNEYYWSSDPYYWCTASGGSGAGGMGYDDPNRKARCLKYGWD